MIPLAQLHSFAEAEYQRLRAAWGWRGNGDAPRTIPADTVQEIIIWSNIRAMVGRDAGAAEWQRRGPSYWVEPEREAMAAAACTALVRMDDAVRTPADRTRVQQLRHLYRYLRFPGNYWRDLRKQAPARAA